MFVPRDRNRNGYIKTWVVWIRGVLGYESGLVSTTTSIASPGEPFRASSIFTAAFRGQSTHTAMFRAQAAHTAAFRGRSEF